MVYGGDEISAVVLDIGSSSTRAGWAGEDSPRAVFPTSYGYTLDDAEMADQDEDAPASEPSQQKQTAWDGKRRYLGDAGVRIWRPNMEVFNPVQDGMLSDAVSLSAITDYAFRDRLRTDLSEHPLLLTEPAWNTKENRESAIEVAFEKFEVPAFYIANNTVLSAFAAGKSTALVVDVGAENASAIPVVDGFVLRKGILRQPTAGSAISRALLHYLKSANPPVPIVPQYLVKSKTPVEPGQAAEASLREDRLASTTDSFKQFAEMSLMHEFKEAVGQVYENKWDENSAALKVARPFEFPDGYNNVFGMERLRASEVMFSPSEFQSLDIVPQSATNLTSVTQMIIDSVMATDVDSRASLLNNIVLVGGGTLLLGFADRISYELGVSMPGSKIKIHSPGNLVERRYSSWLGGSILASLGTFHQLWVSREEYQEHGRAIVNARCK